MLSFQEEDTGDIWEMMHELAEKIQYYVFTKKCSHVEAFLKWKPAGLVGDEVCRVDLAMFVDDKDFGAMGHTIDAIVTLIFKHGCCLR